MFVNFSVNTGKLREPQLETSCLDLSDSSDPFSSPYPQ
jgi:hypothetical protein